MEPGCDAHPFAPAGALCTSCLRPHCAGCLVFADPDAAGPVCLPCALRSRRPGGRRHDRVVVDLR
ncbi:MAG: hypothetical protein H0U89_10125 [Acidimicrobiia bacterium]|nr:hypothetical protein [Acidimicrobiia bacterium]